MKIKWLRFFTRPNKVDEMTIETSRFFNHLYNVDAMKIESLHVGNYRCFEDITVNFDKQLTVLVGVNGAGKTALLDALALPFDPLMQAMRYSSAGMSYYHLSATDLYKQAQDKKIIYALKLYASTEVPLEFRENPTSPGEFVVYDNGAPQKMFSKPIETLLKMVPTFYEHKAQPVFIYYQSKRNTGKQAGNLSQDPRALRDEAFSNATSPTIDFSSSMSWLISKSTEEALEGKHRNDYTYEIPEVAAVRKAITTALEGYVKPRIGGTPHELLITHEKTGIECSFGQLSDGYRAMLALIMDLARRMAVLNENSPLYGKEKVLESPAVVLIDEIELHLHPRWQQTVLPSLMAIFPNTQFIVTTHSPQVLTSIPSKHIRILSEGKVYDAPPGSQGAESSRLLKRIFDVDARPPADLVTQNLEEYKELVYADQWDEERAKELRHSLEEAFAGEDPILTELDLYIDNRKWELEQ